MAIDQIITYFKESVELQLATTNLEINEFKELHIKENNELKEVIATITELNNKERPGRFTKFIKCG